MATLPTPGADLAVWGDELNEWALVAHNADGTLKAAATGGHAGSGTLSSSTTAGATQVTLVKPPDWLLPGGSYVATGALTSKCEVRRVTAVASATLTLDFALSHAHAADENVWALASTWVPPEWFGCKANDSAIDNYTGLQAALIDMALGAGLCGYGLTGRGARYYCATPLAIYDNTRLDNIIITLKTSGFGTGGGQFNPLIGTRGGEPDQFFAMLAGTFTTVNVVDAASNRLSLGLNIGSTVNGNVQFHPAQGATLPAPLQAGRTYYVRTAHAPSANDYTLALDAGGAELDITSSGSGTIYAFAAGMARMIWNAVTFEGISTQGLNGLKAYVQQPSRVTGLRCEGFPGPKGTFCVGGQQGGFKDCLFLGGSIGIRMQLGQFLYFFDTSIEDCDILVYADDVNFEQETSSCRDVEFFGTHWESPGIKTSLKQTIMGDAAVSAGTFTLTFAGQTTGTIAFNASAATIQTALEALSTIDPGDVVVTNEGGALPSGRMRVAFGGQYAWKVMSGTNKITVNTAGLTGGVYTMNYMHPDAVAVRIKNFCRSLGLFGGILSASGYKPDGTGADLLEHSADGSTTNGYVVQNHISLAQQGNAIKDIPRGITVPWANTTGCGERLAYFSAGGYAGGTSAKNWWLAGRLGGSLSWDEYNEELQLNGATRLRFGDTGPMFITHTTTPEGTKSAPPGSLCTDSTNGVLYMKKTGTGNTGWKLVTQAA